VTQAVVSAGRAAAGAGQAAGAAGASSSAGAAAGSSTSSKAAAAGAAWASRPRRRSEPPTEGAAGLILGFFLWAWVILPLLRGGPEEVVHVILAKFVNKTPDGRWLP
jgi:hypothetical protein